MSVLKNIVCIIFCFSYASLWGQNLSNFRQSTISNISDTIYLDSLMVVPQSLILKEIQGDFIPDTAYCFDINTGRLVFKPAYRNQKIVISYRVFPMQLSQETFGSLYYAHFKNKVAYQLPKNYISRPYGEQKTSLNSENINRSGYISRGINFGNNQDVVVNSALNMQLSGQLSQNLKIKAAITDNNIPIQPDGNTQQIQEFDQVYISLYNDNTNLTFGDFELNRNKSYFLKSHKKLMGVFVEHQVKLKKNKNHFLKVDVAGAVAKGKYNRFDLKVQEGVQGPYLLQGENNESYIIILSGTEKVYIDGELLKRGESNDYTIDYNLAEITFTTRRIITKESRIVVEFEYTDKNYAKFTVGSRLSLTNKNSRFWLELLSDHDSKNQPINADYSEAEKWALFNAGDDPFKAFTHSFDSLEFSANEVRYQMIDTLGYDSVFVYSNNPNNAFYRVSFAFVGEGNGNYLPKASSANGRVFEWIAPQEGYPKGSYLPIKLLVTPKSQQMVISGANINLKTYTQVDYELAMSHFDANTFSKRDAEDDLSWAYKVGLKQDILTRDTSLQKLRIGLKMENLQGGFKAFESFRNIEFNRDWNIGNVQSDYMRFYETFVLWDKTDISSVSYRLKMLDLGVDYKGLKHSLDGNLKVRKWDSQWKGSWLNARAKDGASNFYRTFATLRYHLTDRWHIGVLERSENNLRKDSLNHYDNTTYSFFQWEAFNKWTSTKGNHLNLFYIDRIDNGLKNEGFGKASRAQTLKTDCAIESLKGQMLKANFTWRNVQVLDSAISKIQQNEQTYIGKLEHALRLYKNAISFRTMYELSSGLELKKEFAYIEVPDGQGVYQWIDYNDNGVQELNEFEKAIHQDQAKYIRVQIPTKSYEKAYTNQFSETVHFYPYKLWKNKEGALKWISKFSNLFNYKVKKKIHGQEYAKILNPFYRNIFDSILLIMNQSIRNTFSFNKTHSIYGLDFVYLNNQNKSLLSNGFDSRSNESYALNFRLNINTKINLNNQLGKGEKSYHSDFFSANNYHLRQISNLLEISYLLNSNFRSTISYQFKDKQNTIGFQKSKMHKGQLELKYNIAGKTNFQTTISYFFFDYNDVSNTSLAFEMLEGLLPGSNAEWSILFQIQLSKYLQLNLNYLGRVAKGGEIVHNAQAQLRAFF